MYDGSINYIAYNTVCLSIMWQSGLVPWLAGNIVLS